MINAVSAINWKSRLAQTLVVLVTGAALGLLSILTDLAFFTGIMGWIVFAILGLALYGIGEVIWGKILSAESGRQISKQGFSWKRVGYGLFLYLGVFLIASGVYLFAQAP
jgi:hypothetical protein